MGGDESYVWELPGDERARGMARLLIEGVLTPDEPTVREAVGRLASELVAHATADGSTCVLTVEVHEPTVIVTVGGPAASMTPVDVLLEELAEGWGVQASRSGRAVWFAVPRPSVGAAGTVLS